MRRRLPLLLALLLPLLCAAEPAAPTPWAFRKPVRLEPPHVSDPHWVKNPIDAFVLARLDKAGLKPSAPGRRVASSAESPTTSPACRLLSKNSTISLPTTGPTLTLASWTVSWRRLISANAGRSTGSTWPVTRNPRLRGRRRTAERLAYRD